MMNCISDVLQRSARTEDASGILLPAGVAKLDARPEIVSRIVRGFDAHQLCESFAPGQIEHRLLEPGEFDAHLLRINTAKLSLLLFRYSLPIALNGSWPEDCAAVLFGLEMTSGTIAQGQAFTSGAIALFDRATGIDARLAARSKCALLIMRRDVLRAAIADGDGASADIASGVPRCARETEMRRLRGLLRAVLDDAELTGQLLRTPGSAAAFERDVLSTFARALATAERHRPKGLNALERRGRLVKKAEEYVIAHLDESVRMERLCREVGASARALEYAFQGVYCMGAMRYLRTIRLNEVRKALLDADTTNVTTVTSAAMDWGFWHLGEFAAAYKGLFGEVPSETLRTAASRRPSGLPIPVLASAGADD
jgi:AraC family ethanolamine operon transcriptional activator